MIVDVHVHVFPEKIADKASSGIAKFYDMPVRYDGRLETVLKLSDEAGVDKLILNSAATSPTQVESINDFISGCVSLAPERLYGLMTLHPDYENIDAEVDRCVAMGLRGVKLHPDFQKFNIDDPKAFGIYEAIQGRLPLLVHTGDFRYEWSKPSRMARVMELFPRLEVIGAHFGGWSEWDDALEAFKGKRVWVDTSSSMYAMTDEQIKHMIKAYGIDRVMFGTDFPMWGPEPELKRLRGLGLTSSELDMILYKNAENLFKL